ncbi:MAG: hypothetical protein ABIN91_10250 [Mucilaginibacter sp.]|uniref:hypothetical protein n=1 Tax=Mucilaginibacter sp. TaxID=1882438 RepID=UPI0032642DA1
MRADIQEFAQKNPTVILTVLTGYGYFCAYSFETGYCSYFKIPTIFIEIGLVDIIRFAAVTSGIIAFYVIQFKNIISTTFFAGGKSYWSEITGISLLFVTVHILIGYVIKTGKLFDYVIAATFFLTLITYSIMSLVRKRKLRKTASLSDNITISDENNTVTSQIRIKDLVKNDFQIQLYVVFVLIPLSCFGIGYGNASKTSEFEILKEHPKFVVLKRYGENIISKDFNLKTREFGDSLLIVKVGPTTPLQTVLKELK